MEEDCLRASAGHSSPPSLPRGSTAGAGCVPLRCRSRRPSPGHGLLGVKFANCSWMEKFQLSAAGENSKGLSYNASVSHAKGVIFSFIFQAPPLRYSLTFWLQPYYTVPTHLLRCWPSAACGQNTSVPSWCHSRMSSTSGRAMWELTNSCGGEICCQGPLLFTRRSSFWKWAVVTLLPVYRARGAKPWEQKDLTLKKRKKKKTPRVHMWAALPTNRFMWSIPRSAWLIQAPRFFTLSQRTDEHKIHLQFFMPWAKFLITLMPSN